MIILGISAYYHDSAAAIIEDDVVVAAAQEERFTRKKQDERFPENSILYCMEEAGITLAEIDAIVFYDKPFLKFERLLETYLAEAPRGFSTFVKAIPVWLKEKLFLKKTLTKEFASISNLSKELIYEKLLFAGHHESHLSSAFYPSPFEESVVLTIDGVGEWTTTSLAYGSGSEIKTLYDINFPHSLGLLYAAFTYYTGYKVNSGEYKVMGLAPYGKPIYVDKIKENLIDIKADGSFRLDMSYFNFTTGLTMTNDKFHNLFGGNPRMRESELTQKEMDLAASIQVVTEDIMIKMAKFAQKKTGSKNLVLAGGVALNCVGNGEILKEDIFKNIWIQPAAGDAGGALGAAYAAYYRHFESNRIVNVEDSMQGSYLGPKQSDEEIEKYLKSVSASYKKIDNENLLLEEIAKDLSEQKIVGWHHDRMEFGPRSLGHRSILGDPRSINTQSTMNLKIKYRESFRPFAPSVLFEHMEKWFDLKQESPYMLLVAPVHSSQIKRMTKDEEKLFGIKKLNIARSSIPAVTHIDYSARVQSLTEGRNGRYYRLVKEFYNQTECPVLVNTSFNVRGEPIVCTHEDSYRCFMRTEMDVLVIEGFVLYKKDQPTFSDSKNWQDEFELD